MTQAELEMLSYWDARLPDGGPRYVETHFDRLIREPCNAVTAALFVIIVIFFLVRLWGRFRQHPLLCVCMPVLLIGGVGGTIYHGLRAYKVFLYMDVLPILLLAAAGTVYLWIRLKPGRRIIVGLLGFGAALLALETWFLVIGARHIAIVVQYLGLAVFVLLPVGIVLVRTKYRHSQLVKLALVCFGLAILFRFLDPWSAATMPIGTHWLWHILGAGTTALLAENFFRIETEPLRPLTA